MSDIFLLNNEKSTLGILTKLLKTEGFKVVGESDFGKALNKVSAKNFEVVVAGLGDDIENLLKFVSTVRSKSPSARVILVAENGDDAVKLEEAGAFSILEKPLKVANLISIVQKAVDFESSDDGAGIHLEMEGAQTFSAIASESPAMKNLCRLAERVCGTDIAIFLSGEDGTGKGLIARTIHKNSRRTAGPFVEVVCSDIKTEKDLMDFLKKANGGTVYLKNVGKLGKDLQGKLLGVLKDKQTDSGEDVDVRVVSSSVDNIKKMVDSDQFDADLYKHLRMILLDVPALRDRREDISSIVKSLLKGKAGAGKPVPDVEQNVIKKFKDHPWPGNVAELAGVLDQAFAQAQGGRITLANLPNSFTGF